MKWEKTNSGKVKVFRGEKYTYAFCDEKPLKPTLLLESLFTESPIRVTMIVKNFQTAKEIVKMLELK